MNRRNTSWRGSSTYRMRVLGAGAAALLLCVGLVRWWPVPEAASHASYSDLASDRIQLEEIQPTDQDVRRQPPPPAPLPPEVVPEDELVDAEIDWSDVALDITDPGDDAERRDGRAEEAAARTQPSTEARLLRAPQPTYTEHARREEVRARIELVVEVNPQGQVESARIRNRWQVDAEGTEQSIDTLGYGLEEAVLTAVRRAQFRPATDNGEPVATQTVITFRFGPR
ncbi:MAG: energy transducer TonB [Longimonas sp.]|uniref:energy transducer TonB n=1 Tax=Longimonas sp. TaxID=2039626 RepID=UPI0039751483